MNEDDVITRLVAFHDHIEAPDTPAREDAVRGERLVRRRRTIVVGASAAAVILTVGIVQASLSADPGDGQPAPSPTQSESPSTGEDWTPERIRAEGALETERLSTPSGLTVRVYAVCDGAPCNRRSAWVNVHRAMEVAQADQSAVFDVSESGNIGVNAFGDDSVLVADAPGSGLDMPARYRLLQTDRTALELQMDDDPAPAVPGADVVVHNVNWFAGGSGDSLYLVDQGAGTLRPLDIPPEVGGENGVRYWGPNVEEFLWGVSDDCRAFWQTGVTFTQQRLDNCGAGEGFWFTEMNPDWFPAGWLQPGRMALAEQRDDGAFLHVTLDSGASWQRIPMRSDHTTDGLPRSSAEVVAGVLSGLD